MYMQARRKTTTVLRAAAFHVIRRSLYWCLMRLFVFLSAFFYVSTARAQAPVQVCPSASTFNPCDLVFEVPAGQNPQNAQLDAEFRSPTYVTYKMPAFWDGSS